MVENRDHLWEKTKKSFRYVYQHYFNDFHWFMKADDDTYVIVENLRYILKDMDYTKPWYLGRRFKPFVKQGYMSGGGGYVLSREALRRFVKGLHDNTPGCHASEHSGSEDVSMGECMEAVGVPVLDSLDEQGRERFHPFPPESHLNKDRIDHKNWLWSYNYHPLKVVSALDSETIT